MEGAEERMQEMISIHAFSQYVLIDGNRVHIDEQNGRIRPVMSKGQVIAPLAFFEKALGAEVCVSGTEIVLSMKEYTLRAVEGEKKFAVNGNEETFSVPPRREKGCLCIPAAECARALGFSAQQYGQLVVIAPQEMLQALLHDPEEQEALSNRTCGLYNAAKFTSEDFKLARDAWRKDLCGDEKTNDLSVPGMKNLLAMRDKASDELRAEMNRGENIPILFGDKPPIESSELVDQYLRILRMAQPYGTVGCRGYKSKELLDDIVFALDWMHDNMYGSALLSDESYRSYKIFNWWQWAIGAPTPLLDTVMIIEEDISREAVEKYVMPVAFISTQMRTELTTEMAIGRVIPLGPLALLREDRVLLQAEYLDMERVFQEYDSGRNMRRDWCCMTHGMPYNILYGAKNLIRPARLLSILKDTPLAFPLPKKYNLMNMARYTFAPAIYQGRMLSLMAGRMMQERGVEGTLSVLVHLRNLLGLFGEEEDQEICEILRRNASEEVLNELLPPEGVVTPIRGLDETASGMHPATYARYREALTDSKYESQPYQLGYMWYSGDSCVQFRKDYALALRMNSERVPGYECINSANGDGWYTGDGMLYVYTPGASEQYNVEWWKGVDKYLMPGTTVEDRERTFAYILFGRWYMSSKDFVGGVALNGQFVTASMDLESCHNEVDEGIPDTGYGGSLPALDCDLTAMKSWFMMERVTVAVGTAINATDEYDVRTVVENRMLTCPAAEVLVNGEPLDDTVKEVSREDVRSIFIPGTGAYFFTQGGRITIRLYGGEGARFVAFWLEHGRKPDDGKYVYVILPDATAEECAAYDVSDVEILSNDGKIQAVREKHSGLTGIVFREAGTFAGITADQPMIVMLEEKDGKVSLNACDPTQKRTEFSLKVLGAKEVAACDARMTAKREADGLQLDVACDSARGRGYRAELK